jgi:NAD(P)-dependent dehydrogenase (short-subunit alcohol dehydrogenase family)
MSTDKRVALVTGCASPIGIGGATVRKLAADGMIVVATDVTQKPMSNDLSSDDDLDPDWQGLDSLVEQVTAGGGTATAMLCDVGDEAAVGRVVNAVIDRYGRIDVLVNNAGAPHGLDRNQIEDVPLAAWDGVMAINARGPFLMARAVVPHMRKAQWGRIISLSSEAAGRGLPYRGAYSASKAAVVGMTRSLAIDLATAGVTVNAVCPGSVRTTRAMSTARKDVGGDIEAALAERAKLIPMRRHGRPEEIAALIAFLASDIAGFITGQAIGINGGTSTNAI